MPVVIPSAGTTTRIDLGCNLPVHVRFAQPPTGQVFVENTGDAYDITATLADGSTQNVSGHFGSLQLAGQGTIILKRNKGAASIALRY